jgi:WD40 repeat protein
VVGLLASSQTSELYVPTTTSQTTPTLWQLLLRNPQHCFRQTSTLMFQPRLKRLSRAVVWCKRFPALLPEYMSRPQQQQQLNTEVQHRKTLSGHTEGVMAVRFSPDGKFLASASGDKTIKVWRVEDGALEATFGGKEGHELGISDVAWSYDSKMLASCSDDLKVKVWDRATGALRKTLAGHCNCLLSVDFQPKTYILASGSYDTKIIQWDAETGKLRKIMVGHTAPVSSVRYSKDGQHLLSTSYDGTWKLWNAMTGEITLDVACGVPIICASWCGVSLKLALFSMLNSTVQLWRVDLKKAIKSDSDFMTKMVSLS